MEIVVFDKIEDKVIDIRGEKVILDFDIAEIYGVETKRINEAVKNNPDRFPNGYIIEVTQSELDDLRTKFSTAKLSKTSIQSRRKNSEAKQ